jgi:PEGA domain-containing protein/protein kinase-like protein
MPIGTGIVNGAVYLVHEYVDAQSLDLAVREYGPAPAADALRMAAQVAGALDFAAAVNVFHGALHLRDVLLSSDDTRLTGVGVARALESVGVVPPIRRPYAAPERVAGAPWDRRADVFSFAALIYELLSGRRVAGMGARAAQMLPDVGGADAVALRSVFARALAQDPAARFATALEFVDAVNGALPDAHQPAAGFAPRVTVPQQRTLPETEVSQPPAERLVTSRSERRAADATRRVDDRTHPPVDERPPVADAPAAGDRLPLDEVDTEATLALATAEAERYRDVEVAPAIVEPALTADTPVRMPPLALDTQPPLEPTHPTGEAPPADRPRRSIFWPVAAALVVGVGFGFFGGYQLGTHNEAPAAPPTSAAMPSTAKATPPPSSAPSTAAAGREFTESAVTEAPKPQTPAPSPAQSTTPAGTSAAAQPSSEAPGRLLVRSTPAGAQVIVDGREYGETPVAVRDLAAGTHVVRILEDGYVPDERRVAITAARPAQSIIVTLVARAAPRAPATIPDVADRFSGTLVVDSRPSGAQVYVDGRLVGNTPIALSEVRAGEHAVRIERDGYRRWSSSVRVVAAERNRVTASLER